MSRPQKRKTPQVRRQELLEIALELSERIGYRNITRERIAEYANTSCALVSSYYSPIETLKYAVMREAINKGILSVIAQGLSLGDEQAKTIDQDLKNRVAEYLSNN